MAEPREPIGITRARPLTTKCARSPRHPSPVGAGCLHRDARPSHGPPPDDAATGCGRSRVLMNYVVGSGPSGTACARALLDRGRPVTMLDTGFDLEPDMAVHRSRLARALPGQWPQESVSVFKAGLTAGPSGVPLKRVYGSDFPFRAPAQAMEFRQEHTSAARSFAKGGLSRAWGPTTSARGRCHRANSSHTTRPC
jgi:hypothetical protein